ncbi:MAG: 3-methyl-2-oxobutanoate hydroxymethyltransferase [Candidatus Hodarchaeales archaeon]|jgi:3-methyl-2-oxobutanoate hydroxymethyltransferase
MKVTVPKLLEMKQNNEKITMLTAYDYPIASILDEAEIDILLVGDTMGMVVYGYPTTLKVKLEDTIKHTAAVARGAKKHAMVIGDMPFMTFSVTTDEAVRNAGRIMSEGDAEAIKLEGGKEMVEVVEGIINAGIPVMGHVGLTPQSVYKFGGFRVQGKTEKAMKRLKEDALALQEAGIFSIVLEGIPWKLGKEITEILEIPTIGIGAGPHCDGQVLVTYDLLGIYTEFKPKFVKRYANLREIIKKAATVYSTEVKNDQFPTLEYSYE